MRKLQKDREERRREWRRHATTLACCVGLALSTDAIAASFTVDDEADAVDASVGDGLCATASGACSLRAAIQETNAISGLDDITLPAGRFDLTTAGEEDAATAGDLDVTDDLDVTGAGPLATEVSGVGAVRVFHVLGGARLHVSGLTVRDGAAYGGAGILASSSTLEIEDAVVRDNDGSVGGGIQVSGGALRMTATTVRDNDASVAGGGLALFDSQSVVEESAVYSNRTPGTVFLAGGGGGFLTSSGGHLLVANTTVVGNSAGAGSGGGFYNVSICTPALGECTRGTDTDLNNVTIAANEGTGYVNLGLGPPATVRISNSVLADNSLADCQGDLDSLGHNVVEETAVSNGEDCELDVGAGDWIGVDPLLEPLADNGGPTWTSLPGPGSVAIGAGSMLPVGAAPACEPFDQRGIARPVGARCDAGAVESETIDDPDEDCGNGVVEGDEECDDPSPGSCCTTSCFLAPAGAVCRASSRSCDPAELCDGASPSCPADVSDDDTDGDHSCDDVDACTNVGGARTMIRRPQPKLGLSRRPSAPDRMQLRANAQLVLPSVTPFAALDLGSTGARIIVRDASETDLLDVVLPPGLRTSAGEPGWIRSGGGSRWIYADSSDGSTGGIEFFSLTDRGGRSGENRALVRLRGSADLAVTGANLPLHWIVVFGDQQAARSGLCAEKAFLPGECSARGSRLTCRGRR